MIFTIVSLSLLTFICNNVLCLRKGKILTFKVPHRPALLECNTMEILRQNIEIAHHTFLQVALGKKNGSMIFQKILLWIVWRSLQLNLESRHIETKRDAEFKL